MDLPRSSFYAPSAPTQEDPVIGVIQSIAEHRMGRNYLAGEDGDAINAILAAAGYNFSLLIKWLRQLLWLLLAALRFSPKSLAT